jgi:putative transposase
LSPIVVIPKKNGKLKICIDFKKLNVATKKDPYPLPFTNEVLNTITRYERYFFLDEYSGYHQISITLEHKYNTTCVIDWGDFCMEGDTIWSQKWTSNISKNYYQSI